MAGSKTGDSRAAHWVVQTHDAKGWRTTVLPGSARYIFSPEPSDVVSVAALDRNGNLSPSVRLRPIAGTSVSAGRVAIPTEKEPSCWLQD
jgi:hypothetical protein